MKGKNVVISKDSLDPNNSKLDKVFTNVFMTLVDI